KRELVNARRRHRSQRIKSVAQLVFAGLTGVPGLLMVSAGRDAVCLGIGLLLIAGLIGLMGLLRRTRLGDLARRAESAHGKLDELYRRLDEIEEELTEHMEVVRRR